MGIRNGEQAMAILAQYEKGTVEYKVFKTVYKRMSEAKKFMGLILDPCTFVKTEWIVDNGFIGYGILCIDCVIAGNSCMRFIFIKSPELYHRYHSQELELDGVVDE
jgi:hypothetical protein